MNLDLLFSTINHYNISRNISSNPNTRVVEVKYGLDDIIIESNDFKQFECGICMGSIVSDVKKIEIYQCLNAHISCLECWRKQIQSRANCPVCRRPVQSIDSLARNRFMEDSFKEKLVNCPHSLEGLVKSTLGLLNDNSNNMVCDQIVSIEKLDQHIKECNYQILQCDCGSKFQKKDLKRHQDQECKLAKVLCGYCKIEYALKSALDNHYRVCSKYLIDCTNECGSQVQRSKLQEHQNNDCLKQPITCPFSNCQQVLTKQQMIIHLANHIASFTSQNNYLLEASEKIESLEYQLIILNQKNTELELKLNQLQLQSSTVAPSSTIKNNNQLLDPLSSLKLNELTLNSAKSKENQNTVNITQAEYSKLLERISKLENKEKEAESNQTHTNQEYSNQWIIQNYSQASKYFKHKQELKSSIFSINGLQFMLLIFPFGYNGDSSIISLFLKLVTRDKTVKLNFSITLENTLPHKSFTKSHTLEYKSGEIKGFYKFMDIKDVTKENGYMSGDKLKFHFKINIIHPSFDPSLSVAQKAEVLKSNIVILEKGKKKSNVSKPKTTTTTTTTTSNTARNTPPPPPIISDLYVKQLIDKISSCSSYYDYTDSD